MFSRLVIKSESFNFKNIVAMICIMAMRITDRHTDNVTVISIIIYIMPIHDIQKKSGHSYSERCYLALAEEVHCYLRSSGVNLQATRIVAAKKLMVWGSADKKLSDKRHRFQF